VRCDELTRHISRRSPQPPNQGMQIYPNTNVFVLCAPNSPGNVIEIWIPEGVQYNPAIPNILLGTKIVLPTSQRIKRRLVDEFEAVAYSEGSVLVSEGTQGNLDEVIFVGSNRAFAEPERNAIAPRCIVS